MMVQIINMHTEFVRVEDFCFSICQAWTTDCKYIEGTEAFFSSIKHKIAYKTGKFYSHKGRYIKKMMEKFPDYLFLEEKPKELVDKKGEEFEGFLL